MEMQLKCCQNDKTKTQDHTKWSLNRGAKEVEKAEEAHITGGVDPVPDRRTSDGKPSCCSAELLTVSRNTSVYLCMYEYTHNAQCMHVHTCMDECERMYRSNHQGR